MFRLVLRSGLILDDRRTIGRVRRLDGGRYFAVASGKSAEEGSAERAAEMCCRQIDPMRSFVVEIEDPAVRRAAKVKKGGT